MYFPILKDIKRYHYYYWFAYPAIDYLQNLVIVNSPVPLDTKLCAFLQLQSIEKLQHVFLLKENTVDGGIEIIEWSQIRHLSDEDIDKVR